MTNGTDSGYKSIIVDSWREKEGAVGRITFNRPEKLNVMNQEMTREIHEAMDHLEDDDDIKVVIFRGAGRAWSAGFDVGQIGPRNKDGTLATAEKGKKGQGQLNIRNRLKGDFRMNKHLSRLLLYPKPTIAQVHGHCYGGANLFQMCTDMTVAADDAIMGYKDQRMGFGGATHTQIMLINLVGYKRARELTLTGAVVTGKVAAEIGLINRSFPLDKLDDEVRKLARIITLMPRDGIMVGKAQTELAYHRLGFLEGLAQGGVGHHMFQSLSYADDEFIFVKARRDLGTRGAIHARDARYDEVERSEP